jgi:hypothetical protein
MNDLIKVNGNAATVTVSSLQLVESINGQRKPGESELRYADLLAKVPKALGEDERKFSSIYLDSMNEKNPGTAWPNAKPV